MTGIVRNVGVTLALLCAFLVPRADAGQLVSPADREWARKAVAEEKSLSAPAGKNTVAVLYFRNGTGDPSLDPMRKGIPLLLITDLSGLITDANRRACQFLGYSREELVGLKVDTIHRMGTGVIGHDRFRGLTATRTSSSRE